jgi:hypothetical protein
MTKIEISLENTRIAPIERTPELGSVLFGIGRGLMNSCPPISLPGGEIVIKGRPEAATVRVRVSNTSARRERLKRRIVWSGSPGAPGYSSIHARLDVPLDDRAFMSRGEWLRDDALTPATFWATVERVEKRLLDAAEALADRLS